MIGELINRNNPVRRYGGTANAISVNFRWKRDTRARGSWCTTRLAARSRVGQPVGAMLRRCGPCIPEISLGTDWSFQRAGSARDFNVHDRTRRVEYV